MREKWMEEISDDLRGKRINQIFLPGSHDSGSNEIDYDNPIGSRGFRFANKLAKHIKIAKKIINAWTLTQEEYIYGQLLSGIRSFDFRVSQLDGTYYITHTFTCDLLEGALRDIKTFMERYPGEVLVLRFVYDWANRSTMSYDKRKEVYDKIVDVLGDYLIRRGNEMPVYDQTVRKDKRIVLFFDRFYEKSMSRAEKYIWNYKYYKYTWLDSSDVGLRYQYLLDKYEDMVFNNRNMNIMLFTLTPQKEDIKQDVIGRLFHRHYKPQSIESITPKIQAKFDEFINGEIPLHPVTFVTDYPTDGFIDAVIGLNHLN